MSTLLIAEEQCLEGVVQCRQASSFSRDSQGNLRCCMPGYALNSITNSVVNGVMMDLCTCTPMGSGGFMSTFLGNGGGAMLMSNFPSMAGMSGQNGNGQTGNVTGTFGLFVDVYWAVQAGLLTPLTFALHRLSPLAAFTSGAYFFRNERR